MVRGRYLSSMDDIGDVLMIRRAVGSEADDYDKMSIYALVYDEDDLPVGTGRLYIDEDGRFTIGGLCVLTHSRRRGYGDLIIRMLLVRAASLNAPFVYLSAQVARADYYRRYGFLEYGEPFLKEGIPHTEMRVSAEEMTVGGTCCEMLSE